MGPMKAKDQGKTLKRLFSYIWEPYKVKAIIVLVCILVGAVVGVIGSLFLQVLIDDHIVPLMDKVTWHKAIADGYVFIYGSPILPDMSGLALVVFLMGLIYGVGVLSTYIHSKLMVDISQGVLKRIRDDMFSHMQALPVKYFDTKSHGDVMSHYTNDADALRQMISQSLPQVFSSLITVVAVLCAMIYTSIWLTILVLIMVSFMIFVTKTVGGKSSKYFAAQQASIGKVNGFVEEMINGQKVVKVFCHEEDSKKEFDTLNKELFKNGAEANKFANMMMPIMMNLSNLQYVLIAIIGGGMAVNNMGITLGAIAAFLQLSKSFNQPIGQLAQQMNSIAMAIAGAERIFELMDEKEEKDTGKVTLVNIQGKDEESEKRTGRWAWKEEKNGESFHTELKGDVRFEDVHFGYDEGKEIIHGITLYAEPGQKVAFVGATGAGKTTITNLINRFYDIGKGKILYDGIDVRDISKSDLRKSLGMVLQDTHLFTGTVKENIRYGRPEATDGEVIEAAKLANAHGFISLLPEGYETVLSADGGSLSQGQKQLISIARVAVANPPVMILDEATSSIDTRTESIVQKGLDNLMDGRTVFVIAHRLSTVRNADVIMVLESGRIIERGNHERLMSEKGKYYQLCSGIMKLE